MKIYGNESNEAILKELGKRIKERRIALSITQKELSEETSISPRTINYVENGENVSLHHLISILKVLGEIENIDLLIPAHKVNPFEIIDLGHKRKRVSKKKEIEKASWKWGDEK